MHSQNHAADALVTQGATASATMVLTLLSQNKTCKSHTSLVLGQQTHVYGTCEHFFVVDNLNFCRAEFVYEIQKYVYTLPFSSLILRWESLSPILKGLFMNFGCWGPGYARDQSINSNRVDPIVQESFCFSTRRVKNRVHNLQSFTIPWYFFIIILLKEKKSRIFVMNNDNSYKVLGPLSFESYHSSNEKLIFLHFSSLNIIKC